MESHEQKRLLVPLNRAQKPSLKTRILNAVLRPPMLVLGFVFSNLYMLCFGWLDKRLARSGEQRFAAEIRSHLAFLFDEHSAEIIPNEATPFPPPFDGAYVTVAVGSLRLLFVRGRGDFDVKVASAFAPQRWNDFWLVADGIAKWDTRQRDLQNFSLENFEKVLRPRLAQLEGALSKERFEVTLDAATAIHNISVDEYAERLRRSGIEPIVLGQKLK
jgi:hypothetical protein